MPTFAEYLEKWLKQSTTQGLTNPLVKMPIKRFRLLQSAEFHALANGGTLILGTMADPISRNLHKNYQTRIRERGEHCAFICSGAVEMIVAGPVDGKQRKQLFPVCLKRASLQTNGDKIKACVAEDEPWQFNPVLEAHLRSLGLGLPPRSTANNPTEATNYLKAQLGNRASQISGEAYVGLFSSQQMVVHSRLTESSFRHALAKNPVVQAKIAGAKIAAVDLGEPNDDGIEDLGLTLPCDDSQLRVIQLSNHGHSMQVEGPPGTGKSQTIANIISNALFHGKNVLLVCDKKAAVDQVEERLTNVGLKPAILNLHDESLDKREFLRQATEKFPPPYNHRAYPFEQLKVKRQELNERVRFSRNLAHPSLQVSKREALAGLIQLKKELANFPNIIIDNWEALSKERLTRLLGSLGEWTDLAPVLTDKTSVWNDVRVEAFDSNPNAGNELRATIQRIFAQLELLQGAREWSASVGIEIPLNSDVDVTKMRELVTSVIERPPCWMQLIGNTNLRQSELTHLKSMWERREKLVAARHPVILSESLSANDQERLGLSECNARALIQKEHASTWEDLSRRATYHIDRHSEIEAAQKAYRKLCEQLGLVYVPSLTVRRAQLQSIISLATIAIAIPRNWWEPNATPFLSVASWKAHIQACAMHAKRAPLPLHFLALERVRTTHWEHIEAKAEHGFNLISYCLHFINDRKCKYALRQVFPQIPTRGFKQWQEVTLHAVSAQPDVQALRAAAESHVVLQQLTSTFLVVAHDQPDIAESFVAKQEVLAIERLASMTEQMRDRNDLFNVSGAHWQTFWESPHASLMATVKLVLSELDTLALPDAMEGDNLEDALACYYSDHQSIVSFLDEFEQRDGNRNNTILSAFAAQRDFAECHHRLRPLGQYWALQQIQENQPNWTWLQEVLEWRDSFEQALGRQKLDIDSKLWGKLDSFLKSHQSALAQEYQELNRLYENPVADICNYEELGLRLKAMAEDLPRQSLWLEKKRWRGKIGAFPEIRSLWSDICAGRVKASHAQKLFCFNLLHRCEPVAKPHGPELKQALIEFAEHDENLASWIIEHLKGDLRSRMSTAAQNDSHSESELRRLSGLQRVRGTVRELVNGHLDYLIGAKPCWMMSPTSLANLIDSQIFASKGIPFDLVVFDEASQIRVLDGLLSMAFGKQVIIVGDKNQLPPTDFFAGFTGPDAETDEFGVSESVLEEFGGVFEEGKTQVMLMSHYRSETPDLISFSNNWFYGGKLEMYPPARVTGIGRRLHYVPNAVYSESGLRNNPAEAQEIVKLIELHVRDHADKSLGVVTMNISQMELIEELLLSSSLQARAFCGQEAKFFIRNLETVQGDEMDRILLSLTYGKNSSGQFNASVLGPLNKSGGERRLNVAITRSRSGLIVVTSLRVTDLEKTSAQSRGFCCLRDFLAELEATDRSSRCGIGSKRFERKYDGVANSVYCESPFEEQVVEFLENEGYEIECQYGAGNYRLDIVVKEGEKNVLAIECDGAAYHSSLVARTRDRARQKLLEKMGWRVHRVWSTNWWHFEQEEKAAMIAAIHAARKLSCSNKL